MKAGMFRHQLDRVCHVTGFQDANAAELLLRFGEGTVGNEHRAVAPSQGLGRSVARPPRLFPRTGAANSSRRVAAAAAPPDVPAGTPVTLADAEREHILGVLRDTRWVVGGPKGAAARLGMK